PSISSCPIPPSGCGRRSRTPRCTPAGGPRATSGAGAAPASPSTRAGCGHRFTLDMGGWGQQPCEVLAVEPGQMISYSFAGGSLDTTITWRVEPEGTGTRLFLEHRGFDLESPMGKAAFDGMGG